MNLAEPRCVNPETCRKLRCRYCESSLSKPFLELGTMALANSFLTKDRLLSQEEFVCPLSLTWCPTCHLVQLSHVVPAELMYSHYVYVSSTTETFRRHFSEYARKAGSRYGKKEGALLAVDIGSNDGLLLSCYQNEGMKAVGVEPAKNLSDEANQKGLQTVNDYFGRAVVERILRDFGPADLVSANNVFAHIDDIHDVCRNLKVLLDPQGIFIIEFPYLGTMFKEILFDMIYHEHLSYIAVRPLKFLLERFDLEIFDIERVASHGGSLRVAIQKKGAGRPVTPTVETLLAEEASSGYGSFPIYQQFSENVQKVRAKLLQIVRQIKSEGGTLSGYGAPAKGNTLINFCRFSSSEIEYLVDDNPLKQNLAAPGSRIPVVPSKVLLEKPTDAVLIFAWNFAEEILKKLEPLRKCGVKFIIPLPEPRIV